MVCPYLEDLWELFLLDALSADEARAASDHLATGCLQCGEQLRDAALSVYFLLHAERSARPRPESKASLMRRLKRH